MRARRDACGGRTSCGCGRSGCCAHSLIGLSEERGVAERHGSSIGLSEERGVAERHGSSRLRAGGGGAAGGTGFRGGGGRPGGFEGVGGLVRGGWPRDARQNTRAV